MDVSSNLTSGTLVLAFMSKRFFEKRFFNSIIPHEFGDSGAKTNAYQQEVTFLSFHTNIIKTY